MKPGTRLKSAACDTEVMVIHAGDGTIECGGVPMGEARPDSPAPLSADFAAGTLIGKRYVDADGKYELLCATPGKGSLSVDGTALVAKEARSGIDPGSAI
ncbi:hypothetical protein [Novosphingobium aquimarinum]|uniref:hypothetical protein n=1 Tax=Novosphingobium aquimarinum TaxID=2682494 RepID=UPI0012EB56AE|nr:hypothetical protein [Novosphingobium aquimarinum]